MELFSIYTHFNITLVVCIIIFVYFLIKILRYLKEDIKQKNKKKTEYFIIIGEIVFAVILSLFIIYMVNLFAVKIEVYKTNDPTVALDYIIENKDKMVIRDFSKDDNTYYIEVEKSG